MKFEENSVLRRSKVPWQELDGSVVLLNPARRRAHELNEVGSWIWMALESPTTLKQLAVEFCSEFEVDAKKIKKDLVPFVETLSAEGLVEWR